MLGGGVMSQSITEGKMFHDVTIVSRSYLGNSLWRIPHWKDAACTYYERHHPASSGYGRCLGESGYTIACVTQFSARAYLSRQVAYVDTEGTFRPDRIRSIAERFGVNGDMALENILYGTP